jgi:hypothetical protein
VVLDGFLSFLNKFEKNKTHSFQMAFSLISWNQGVFIVENKWPLFLRLLKCHHVLHPMAKSKYLANQLNDENSSLTIF